MDKNERRAKRDTPAPRQRVAKMSAGGKLYIDYKETETLRKLTAGNGKMLSRRRSGASALEQRIVAQAVKRARFMALVPYQTAAQ